MDNLITNTMSNPTDDNIAKLKDCVSGISVGFLELKIVPKEHYDKFYSSDVIDSWIQNKDLKKLYAALMQFTNDLVTFHKFVKGIREAAKS